MQNDAFKELLWEQAATLYRPMPWRDDTRPYYVLVSELMLQQTQVARVIPKFEAFVAEFPNEHALASVDLSDILTLWQGLGYNRRAKYLHDAAKRIVNEFEGTFPTDPAQILSLPGVGANTKGAIEAYAFNKPSLYVETNVRTVLIYHFFADLPSVTDAQLIAKLAEVIDTEHSREFYWALMDYGSWLKSQGVRNGSQSKHYKRQSALEGSVRQVRGQIVRELSARPMSIDALKRVTVADDRFSVALSGLIKDGLVSESTSQLHLTK